MAGISSHQTSDLSLPQRDSCTTTIARFELQMKFEILLKLKPKFNNLYGTTPRVFLLQLLTIYCNNRK